ncbi:C-type lectin galactose-binding isoform-like [Pollicipes pollicipes]|uniref:C-type lectin galactose-binding isoform-like n=1 Tax=Pollicipes pollicipes TaxID=41117 RepID=UPI001884BDFD|nr:C-type lectin galactose-binding isoform-like [Pollicipes pollicipes]
MRPHGLPLLALFCLALLALGRAEDIKGRSRYGRRRPYFSWRELGRDAKFTWDEANYHCHHLGLDLVSIGSYRESRAINRLIYKDDVDYIWTSGRLSPRGYFYWTANGHRVKPFNWSGTGSLGRPQPDDSEGHEYCMAVLNNVYNDGITWHDIACHHRKPFICE